MHMCQVLLLTKCSFAEQELEQQIRLLGHEVYTTSALIDLLKQQTVEDAFFDYFQLVLLSETIPECEKQELLPQLLGQNLKIVQKVEQQLSREELHQAQEQGISCFVAAGASMAVLRELLTIPKNEQSYQFKQISHMKRKKTELSHIRFTNMEQALLENLIQANGEIISREELCVKIWNNQPTNSNQSQLSCLVKKIKRKLKEAGFNSECLETFWGKGYRLNKKLFEYEGIAS